MTRNLKLMLIFIAVLMCANISVVAADDVNITLEGHFGGAIKAVAISDNYTYVGQGQDLVVLDTSNVTIPLEVSRLSTADLIWDIKVVGNYAYVANYNNGLLVVNITNPSTLLIEGNCSIYAIGVTISENYAYVASGANGLVIVNISNSTMPTLEGNYDTAGGGYNIAIFGNYAYVADGQNGFLILDVSNPSVPTFVGNYSDATYIWDVVISGNYAYLADYTLGLVVLDINNPMIPTFVCNPNPISINARNIGIFDDYIYVVANNALVVFRISDPTVPVFIDSYSITGIGTDVAISENNVYLTDRKNGLSILDKTYPTAMTLSGNYDSIGYVSDVNILNNYAYVGDYYDGLLILNISNPTTPTLVGSYDVPGPAYDVAVYGNYAYVAAPHKGLVITNISNPTYITSIASYETTNAHDVFISGDYAYISDYGVLLILNVSHPESPILVGQYADTVKDVIVSNGYAYGVSSSGFQIINISNPTTPTFVWSYDIGTSATGLTIYGKYAYVTNGQNGLYIFDISNSETPTLVGSYNAPGNPDIGGGGDVEISGNYAYVTGWGNKLTILNVSDVTAPVSAGVYDTVVGVLNLAILGDYVYLSNLDNGLAILRTNASDADHVSPTIDITSPSNNMFVNSSSITVTGTSSDLFGIENITVNGVLATGTTDWSANIQLVEGLNLITVVATDYFGNTNTTSIYVTCDLTPPFIKILSPINNQIYNNNSVNLNYTISEPTMSEWYSLDGGNNISHSGNTTLDDLPDGTHNVTVFANDSAGNMGSAVVNFSIDTTPPTAPTNLKHTDDAPSGYDNDNNTEISWSPATDVSSSVIYRIYRDGVLNGSTISIEYTFTNETEGSHTYNVSANDSVGNINTTNESETVIVDYTKPVIHNLSLSDTSPSYGQQIIVSVNITDAVTNITSIIAGSTPLVHLSGVLWNGTITAGYGTNTVTVTAYDNASNSVTNTSLAYIGPAKPTTSSSGGGGGGTSGEDFYNIFQSETDRQSVFKNSNISFRFEHEENILQHINFTALNSAGTIAAKVEILKNTSTLVNIPPPHKVFKNLNIWVGNYGWATDKNIKDTIIGFKVEKSWIEDNDIVVSTIKLCRYHDNVWNPLPTKKSGEDDTYMYFKAKTLGFSPFSITGSTEEEILAQGTEVISTSPNMSEQTIEQVANADMGAESGDESQEDNKGAPKVWYLVVALIIMLIGGAYQMYRARMEDGGK